MDKEQNKIAQRAYMKWLERGGSHGEDLSDWLAAEKEVAAGKKKPGKAPAKKKTAAPRTGRSTK